MKKQTAKSICQTQKTKNFNSKPWIRVMGVLLSIAMVAIVCLGVFLYQSTNRITSLQSDLNGANKTLGALKRENQKAESEIDSLQSSLSLLRAELERMAQEDAKLKESLEVSKAEQKTLEERLNVLEEGNRVAQNEIDQQKDEIDQQKNEINQLKSEINQLKSENDQLKSEIESANGEIADLKEQLNESEDKIRIYIDQGHNPAPHHNSGASGNGLREEDLTFLIGCLLADLLETDKRFEVQLSRPDQSVVLGSDNKSSLMARVEGAAAFNADYFISLHTNSFTQDTAHGIEVWVAEEASESYVFGESLLNGMIQITNLRNRGMKLGPDLDILEFSSMPVALLEMGFISNSGDAALLSEHPELFAQGIYQGILDYFGFLPVNPVEKP